MSKTTAEESAQLRAALCKCTNADCIVPGLKRSAVLRLLDDSDALRAKEFGFAELAQASAALADANPEKVACNACLGAGFLRHVTMDGCIDRACPACAGSGQVWARGVDVGMQCGAVYVDQHEHADTDDPCTLPVGHVGKHIGRSGAPWSAQ